MLPSGKWQLNISTIIMVMYSVLSWALVYGHSWYCMYILLRPERVVAEWTEAGRLFYVVAPRWEKHFSVHALLYRYVQVIVSSCSMTMTMNITAKLKYIILAIHSNTWNDLWKFLLSWIGSHFISGSSFFTAVAGIFIKNNASTFFSVIRSDLQWESVYNFPK